MDPHRNPRGYLKEEGQQKVDFWQAGEGGPVSTSLQGRALQYSGCGPGSPFHLPGLVGRWAGA